MKIFIINLYIFISFSSSVLAQEDLYFTFKDTRIINTSSVETLRKGVMDYTRTMPTKTRTKKEPKLAPVPEDEKLPESPKLERQDAVAVKPKRVRKKKPIEETAK